MLPLQQAYEVRSSGLEYINAAVRKMLTERGIIPENLPPAEDIKKVERRLASEQKRCSERKRSEQE